MQATVLLLCIIAVHVNAQAFVHPGVFVSGEQLAFVKAQVNAGVEPFASEFQSAVKNQIGSHSYKPEGPPASGIIECGPYSKPDYGCSADDNDGSAAYLQALLWYITGDTSYASVVINLLNTYGENLKAFTNSNGPLQAAWSLLKWTRAAEIIKNTDAGWSQSDFEQYTQMLYRVYLPKVYHGAGDNGNWELSMIEGMFGLAVLTENSTLFNHSIEFWRQRVPAYVYSFPLDGNQPVPAPRGNPGWYGNTVWNMTSNGICQETCRDFGHVQMGLASLINAAETAYIQGVDLYSEAQERLVPTLEFHTGYLTTHVTPAWLCDGTVNTKAEGATFEVAYNAYHNRLNVSLPNTWQHIVEVVRKLPNENDLLISIYETLTHGGSPSAV